MRSCQSAKRPQDNAETLLIPRRELESGEQTMEAHIVFLFVCGLLLFLQNAGRVKCEKSKQPKNDQNRSDYREYVFMSLISGSENIYAILPDLRIYAMNCCVHSGLNRTALVNRVTQQRMPGAFNWEFAGLRRYARSRGADPRVLLLSVRVKKANEIQLPGRKPARHRSRVVCARRCGPKSVLPRWMQRRPSTDKY
jgi:hypothetical protein